MIQHLLKKLQLIHSKVVKYIPKKAKQKPWELTQKEIEQRSFYPETKKKPLTIIHQEFRYLCSKGRGSWTHENTISHYFQFGLDRLGTDIHNYIFQEKYDKARDAEHPVFSSMLEHKGYTATVLKDAGINISCPLGTLDAEGNIHKGNRIVNTLQQLINSSPHNAYFCKPIDGFQSRDCYKINCENTTYKLNNESYTYTEVLQKLTNHSIEPYIEQHSELNKLYPLAVNTLRIVTICRNKEVIIYTTAIMIGSEGSHVSGIPFGGIVVEIDKDTGILCSLGHKNKKPNFGKLTHHPDTGVQLQGFKLPMWDDVIQLAKEAHLALSDIPSIGWDIAITPTAPIIVEANQNWGTAVAQYVSNTHKPIFDHYFGHLVQ